MSAERRPLVSAGFSLRARQPERRTQKRYGIALLACFCLLLPLPSTDAAEPAAYPVASTPQKLTPLMERELRGCVDFFWENWIQDPALPTYGLHLGDYIGMNLYVPVPIENQGYYLAAIVIGIEHGWIDRKDGEARAILCLEAVKKMKQIKGFHYHFTDVKTGKRGWNDSINVELTNAGTATMLCGAIVAGEYFGGRSKTLADELYAQCDWKWFTNPKTKHPYLACHPEDRPKKVKMDENGFFGTWGTYAEHMMMYVLGAGAPNPAFATGADSYYAMARPKGSYKGEEFIFCGSGSAFVYQWTHCWVDFRNMVDRNGTDWHENSRQAALAARRYAIDAGKEIKGLGENSWGMSASMSPVGMYSGHYGSKPWSWKPKMDGTVAPYGSSGFMVFTPKESLAALEYMYTIPGLVGKYGLYDAYSFHHEKAKDGKPWVAKSYLAIDKGIVLIMFENYHSQLIWRLFHQNEQVQKGLKALEFRNKE